MMAPDYIEERAQSWPVDLNEIMNYYETYV